MNFQVIDFSTHVFDSPIQGQRHWGQNRIELKSNCIIGKENSKQIILDFDKAFLILDTRLLKKIIREFLSN